MEGSLFKDRLEAGQMLADRLRQQPYADPIVLALPRGGVPVAAEIAEAMNAPLDCWLVRKLGVPGQEELAMGAIAEGGFRVMNDEIVQLLQIPPSVIEDVAQKELAELNRRAMLYRSNHPPVDISTKTVILVDDGLATGASMRAAVQAAYAKGAMHCTVAVPVGAIESCDILRHEADEVICLFTPEPFASVGQWYERFDQTSDEEVRQLLGRFQHSAW